MKLLLFILSVLFVDAAKEKAKPIDPSAEHVKFSADISRLMNLIVNSLYSNKEIFLRELISNAADALNKVRMESAVNPAILGEGDMQKLEIRVIPDEDAETLVITDTGIGMSKEELVSNLGTIAHSGTLKFFEAVANGTQENDLIGQFGVGFYSAFLVATRVEVTSRRYNTSQYVWTSIDAKSFTISEDKSGEDLKRGTKVKLFLKDARYGNSSIIHALIDKYSRFIEFPIFLQVEKEDQYSYERRMRIEERYRKQNDPRAKKDEPEEEEEEEIDDDDEYIPEPEYEFIQVNEQAPLWERDPDSKKEEDEITPREFDDFFHAITYNRYRPDAPLLHIHYHSGKKYGEVPFKTLLFVPPRIPPGRNRWAVTRVTQLRLYVKKVLVTEELVDMLPDHLTFVRGVLEIEDLRDPLFSTTSTSKGEADKQIRNKKKAKGEDDDEDDDSILLNVSREMLQKSEALKQIAKTLSKLIIQHLVEFSQRAIREETDEDIEAYDTFYREYSREIKNGIRDDNDNRKELARLLRFNSTLHEEKLISLEEYVEEAVKTYKDKEEKEKQAGGRVHHKENPDRLPILYYAVDTEDVDKAMSFVRESPFVQPFIADRRDVLLLFDPFDEAVLIRTIHFQGHPIQSVQEALKNRVREFEERGTMKKRFEQWRKDLKPLVNWMSSVLAGKVDHVEVSTKLAMGDFERAWEQERENRMDAAEREKQKEEAEAVKEKYSRLRKKQPAKQNNDNGVVIAGPDDAAREAAEKKFRRKHPSLLHKLKKDREEAAKEGRTLPGMDARVSLKKSVPCAIVGAEGALSAGLNRLYYDSPEATPEMKRRMSSKVFEINPVSPLIQRLNKAYTAIQARRAKELEQEQRKAAEAATQMTGAGGPEDEQETKPESEASTTTAQSADAPKSEDDLLYEIGEDGEPTAAADMKKLEKLLLSMYETAMIHSGYAVKERIQFAERLYDTLSSLTGLPHAPVLPDEIDEDFDEWLEKEAEEQRDIIAIEKAERKRRRRAERKKKLRAEGVEFTDNDEPDPATMTDEEREKYERKLRKFERKKRQRDQRKKEREERKRNKNRPGEEYFEEEEEEEDPEDVLNRELQERREMRKRRREAARNAQEKKRKTKEDADEGEGEGEGEAEAEKVDKKSKDEDVVENEEAEEEEEQRQREKKQQKKEKEAAKTSDEL